MGRNALLALILFTALGAALWIRSGPSPKIAPNPAIQGQDQPSAMAPSLPAPALESLPPPPGEELAPRSETDETDLSEGMLRLLVVDVTDGSPLPGISAYVGEELLAGPSDESGQLELIPPPGLRTTFWGPGWTPRQFHSRDMPTDRVELTAATASLEVLVDHLAPEEGVLHSRVESMDWTATSKTAWSPTLDRIAPYRLQASDLAPGRYQVYVWIGAAGDQGLALEPVEVVLEPTKKTVVRLDANARPDDEVDS